MAEASQFKRGDVVTHPQRPQWGAGTIREAAPASFQGVQGQRLLIHFANHGMTTINTAVVSLKPKESDSQMSYTKTSVSSSGQGWLGGLNGGQHPHEELFRLPEPMTDPFAGLTSRLTATLASFRYRMDTQNPGLLFEWASSQTGLADPLTKYTRHELEQAFPRFARDRERHLKDLARLIKSKGRMDILQETMAQTSDPVAKAALQQAMRSL